MRSVQNSLESPDKRNYLQCRIVVGVLGKHETLRFTFRKLFKSVIKSSRLLFLFVWVFLLFFFLSFFEGGGGVYGETDRPNQLLNLVEKSDSMMDLSSIST